MQERGRWTVVALVSALALVVVANIVAGIAGFPLDWFTSLGTAVVVGGFLAFILLRPRKPKADGFTVETVE